MKSRARIANHPIHPMLILIPAGAFLVALFCDVLYIITGNGTWWEATPPVITIGVAGALVAAVPGTIDLFAVGREHKAMKIGLAHMILNLIAVALFAWNAWLRWDAPAAPAAGFYPGFWLTLAGNALIAVSGWLGGTMVYEHRLGVVEQPRAEDPPHVARPR